MAILRVRALLKLEHFNGVKGEKKMARIAYDMDDCICAYVAAFLDYYNRHNGTCYTMDDFIYYHSWDVFGITHEEGYFWENQFANSEEARILPVIPNASEVISRFNSKHSQFIVTARWSTNAHTNTLEQLEYYVPGIFNIDSIFFTSRGSGKSPVCKSVICQQNGFDILIDDRYFYIDAVAALGIEAILFQPDDYHWNVLPDVLPSKVHLAKNWHEVEAIINQLFP